MIPRLVGPYEIRDELGKGGIGVVYSAVDRELGRAVAIKALRPELSRDRTFVDRFRAEATSLARLNHPNITTLYSLHRDGADLFMVMELVVGHTLEMILSRLRRLGVEETLAIIAQVASGLGYAHRMGVIHRDIKPSNLMVTEAGLVKIMDFGIARIAGSQRFTRQGEVIGTLAYLAPEQLKGSEGNEQSDLYSVGIVCYELLSGQPPFGGNSEYELITAQVQATPPPLIDRLPGLDPRVEATLLRALAKTPQERFPGVEAFSQAIGAAAVRGEAADIVRERILNAGGLPPPPTRAINTSALFAEPPPDAASTGAAPLAPTTIHEAGPPAKARPSAARSLRIPAIAAAAIAVVILAAGLTFELRGSSRPRLGEVVPFSRDLDGLLPQAQSVIAAQASFLMEHPHVTVTVKGYCTHEEGVQFGPGVLAQLRASKVVNELVKHGIDRTRLSKSSGAAATVCDADNPHAAIVQN